MLRYLADEDFDNRIVRGLERRVPEVDIVTIQQLGRDRAKDPANLEFASRHGRVLLSHDKRLIPFANHRVEEGKAMPGVFVVHQDVPIGVVVRDLMDLTLLSLDNEWEGQVIFVPLGSA